MRHELLVDVLAAEPEARGTTVYLVRLTDLRRVQAPLASLDPVPQRLLNRHKSAEHALLILQAATKFAEAGYTVDQPPAGQPIPEGLDPAGTQHFSDLAISKDDVTRYVECECETHKQAGQRNERWRRIHASTDGLICVVTPLRTTMDAINREITDWAMIGGYRVELWVTNLLDMTPAQPWKVQRTIGRRT